MNARQIAVRLRDLLGDFRETTSLVDTTKLRLLFEADAELNGLSITRARGDRESPMLQYEDRLTACLWSGWLAGTAYVAVYPDQLLADINDG